MSALADIDTRPVSRDEAQLQPMDRADAQARPTAGVGAQGRPYTCDDELAAAWRQLLSHETSACPVCGGVMSPQYSAVSRPVGGRCTSCATTLQ